MSVRKPLLSIVGTFVWVVVTTLCHAQPPQVGDVPYQKQGTRADTEKYLLRKLRPDVVEWGGWHLCGPFPYPGHGQNGLATPHGPEKELLALRAGDTAGPDFALSYPGKNGVEAKWRSFGNIGNNVLDLRVYPGAGMNDNVQAYLHGTATVEQGAEVELFMGSDDGLRLWLNGELLIDNDVPRGLNPHDERVTLKFRPGSTTSSPRCVRVPAVGTFRCSHASLFRRGWPLNSSTT